TEAVAGNVQYIVDAAHNPVVAILVAAGVVPRQVLARHLAPVLLAIPLVVPPDPAQHAGPWTADHQPSPLARRHGLSAAIDDLRHDTRKRLRATARLGGD